MARRIRTILYGDQHIEAGELDLLHTPALQRLYDLHQLGLTDRVFVDASHSRLQHVIGVLEQVDNVLNAVAANLSRKPKRKLWYRGVDGNRASITSGELSNYVRSRRRAARLMGLLHDLTHAPFGHTLEDEIELQPLKHDAPERQADAFYRLLCQYIGWVAVDAGSWTPDMPSTVSDDEAAFRKFFASPGLAPPSVDRSFIAFAAGVAAKQLTAEPAVRDIRIPSVDERIQLFKDLRFAMRALLWLDALHKDHLDDLLPGRTGDRTVEREGSYAFEQLIDSALVRAGETPPKSDDFVLQRDAFLLDVIGNTICADLLDYAKRDSHFAALKLDYDVDRIVENFTIVSHTRRRNPSPDKAGYARLEPMLRTAISIFSHKLRIDAPGELMNLLQVRFYVYQRVLFHPTKCIAGAMLGSAIQLLGWKELPILYRFMGDAVFLHEVAEVARLVQQLLDAVEPARRLEQLSVFSDDLLAQIENLPRTTVTMAASELLAARTDHPVQQVLDDVCAGAKLLNRLGARRYHRPVFRLLPNVEIPHLNLTASNVAAVFREPRPRAAAEREIEAHADLPKGSVTIHCPGSDGPKKIAEILILSEEQNASHAYPLREIATIDEEIFSTHQEAIQAVERMYASMWRLVVSVAPPHHLDHARIVPVISRVLYAALAEESYESIYGDEAAESPPNVPNDRTMEAELAAGSATEDDVPIVRVVFPDGREESRPIGFLQVADEAIALLEQADSTVQGLVVSRRVAAEGGRIQIRETLGNLISRGRTSVSAATPRHLGEGRATDDGSGSADDQLPPKPRTRR